MFYFVYLKEKSVGKQIIWVFTVYEHKACNCVRKNSFRCCHFFMCLGILKFSALIGFDFSFRNTAQVNRDGKCVHFCSGDLRFGNVENLNKFVENAEWPNVISRRMFSKVVPKTISLVSVAVLANGKDDCFPEGFLSAKMVVLVMLNQE